MMASADLTRLPQFPRAMCRRAYLLWRRGLPADRPISAAQLRLEQERRADADR